MLNWYKKEKPFQGMVGYGGGATGLRNAGLLGTPFDTEWMVLGGGGGGANGFGYGAGGGGAGGYRSSYPEGPGGPGGPGSPEAAHPVRTATEYPVAVGAGGAPQPTIGYGTNGGDSNFDTLVAAGGGGGSLGQGQGAYPGGNGGGAGANYTGSIGGTGSRYSPTSPLGPDNPAPNQGYPGGNGGWQPAVVNPPSGGYGVGMDGGGGGGGGGAGATALYDSPTTTPTHGAGAGGVGRTSTITGSSVNYAGGGSGGVAANVPLGKSAPSAGLPYGGGRGASPTEPNNDHGTDGTANTGGGGGGGANFGTDGTGGAGGSGIVVLRYPDGFTLTAAPTHTTPQINSAQPGSTRVTTFTAGSGNISWTKD